MGSTWILIKDGALWPQLTAFDYYLGRKAMDIVRMGVRWEDWQPVLGGSLDADYTANVRKRVNLVGALRKTLILEPHQYGRRAMDGAEHIIGESDQVTAAHFADFWSKIAALFKDDAHVQFEIQNEPHDQDDAILVAVTNAAIRAIRETGATNFIYVDFNNWSNSWGLRRGSSNYTHMGPKVVDPLDHFAFDVHHYLDDYSAGTTLQISTLRNDGLQRVTEWARAQGKRLFLGEFAFGDDPASTSAGKAVLDLVENNTDVWIGWAHLGGGGNWRQHYRFRLDPIGGWFDADSPDTTNPPNWALLPDMPAFELLAGYIPGCTYEAAFQIGDAPELTAWFRPHAYFAAGSWPDNTGRYEATQTNPAQRPPVNRISDENPYGARLDESRWLELKMPAAPQGVLFAVVTPDKDTSVEGVVGGAVLASRQGQAIPSAEATMAAKTLVEFTTGPTPGGQEARIGGGAFAGAVHELIFLTGEPSEALRRKIQGRLAWDHKLALPPDHPYAGVQPPP